ncbi:MAG: TlpA disulfide reductase family protein [Elusimicrobia bacterium]|nr:TlpA disulfide reductase family protein [Elusimicrobiota bacterium]
MKKLLLLCVFAIAFSACSGREENSPARKGQALAAPQFSLPALNGKIVNLKDYVGKTALIYFWSINCSICSITNPVIAQLHNIRPKEKFAVIGINLGDSREEVRRYFTENKLSFPTLSDDGEVAFDYGARGTPYILLIDGKGIIRKTWAGFYNGLEAEIDSAITDLINNPA